jgi:hypothetical protein
VTILSIVPASSQKIAAPPSPKAAIAILLLDLENIRLDIDEEKFLQTCCQYPLQIKIAFANWRSVNKQLDAELNDRGYQMIHVPTGKNSADMKMTALGSSLFVAYPGVKEVFVCSSDSDLAHLCNTLRLHGLTPYAVRRGSASLQVINTLTKQAFPYAPPTPQPSLLPIADYLEGIKGMIRAQQQTLSSQWVESSWLSKKFQETYGVTLNQVVSHHMPNKQTKDFFLDRPEEFVIHRIAGQQVIYISLFTSPKADLVPLPSVTQPKEQPKAKSEEKPEEKLKEKPHQAPSSIRSRQQLEKALLTIIRTEVTITDSHSILFTKLLNDFQKQHGETLRYFLDTLNIKNKALVFVKNCQGVELEQVGKIWHVSTKTLCGNMIRHSQTGKI